MNVRIRKRLDLGKKEDSRVCYRKWSEWQEGDSFVATFIKTRENPTYGNDEYLFKVVSNDFVDKEGNELPDLSGQILCLNSCGRLQKLFERGMLSETKPFGIMYQGTAAIEKGKFAGKPATQIDFFPDPKVEGSLADSDDFGF